MGLRIGIVLALALAVCEANAGGLRWRLSESHARIEARKSNKVMMVDLYRGRAGWTTRMVTDTYPDKSVVEYAARFVPVRLSFDAEGAELAKKYKVNRPHILFIDPNGRLVHRIVGYHSPRWFLIEMRKAHEAHRQRPLLTRRLAANPNDFEASVRMASIDAYAWQRTALTHLKKAEKLQPGRSGPLFAEAYNAVGDYLQGIMDYKAAIPHFRRAAAIAPTPYDRAYSYISCGSCYYSLRDMPAAQAELKKVLAMPDAHDEDKEIATRLLGFTGYPVAASKGR